jgi:hypothetical protein
MADSNNIIELDLADIGKVKGERFDKAKGYYNQMYLDADNDRFIKLTKIDFDENLAKKLLRELIYYHKFLRDVGVKVPDNYYLGVYNGTHILEIDEYIPMTFKEAVEEFGIEKTVKMLLDDVFGPLLNSSEENFLECGIDTPLRNFQFKNSHAYYIDFFLPRVFFGIDQTMLEIPDLTDPRDRMIGLFNKYQCKGVLYSLFINLCREYPDKRDFFKTSCINLAKDLKRPELSQFIENSVVEQVFKKRTDDQKEFIENLTFENEEYFVARDFACYLASLNDEFGVILEEFFKSTSNAAGNSFFINPRIDNAKKMLLKHL